MNRLRVLSISLSFCGVWSNPILQRISRVSHKKCLPNFIALPLCERYVHNSGMIYGYARVSTDGQSVEAQVVALTAAGAVNVYREVASGPKTDRAQLRHVLAKLAAITGTGAEFKLRGDAWAGTTPPHGRLLPTVLGGLAEFERELIRARTKVRRVHLGRRPKLTPYQKREASVAVRTASR